MTADYEAVQYGEWKPWHAVRSRPDGTASDVTFCGLDAIKAKQMWRSWNQMHEDERCKRCARSRDLNDRGTP